VGITLQNLQKEEPEKYAALKKAVKADPFIRYVLTNVDTSLAATDEDIMKKYASLVQNETVRNKFLNLFIEEYRRAKQALDDLLEVGIEKRRVQHYYSNLLRTSIMPDLHIKQVSLLKKWREERNGNGGHDETLISLL